ncbi:MAG: cyclic nucleotide-binding/CBS domain-containing protein [Pararhodobacter sp.]|nr:cyclic nucleotide-binding/CBS domain-containing protein [Pararhodobacter sp.]
MEIQVETIKAFLESVHPYDSLPQDELVRVATSFSRRDYPAGSEIYAAGEPIRGLFVIKRGAVEVIDRNGALVSLLGMRNSFGERGLLRDGLAVTSARTTEDSVILMLPETELRRLIEGSPAFARFFNRSRGAETRGTDLSAIKVGELMARSPVTIAPEASVTEAARLMRDKHISSLAVTVDGALHGIITTRDLAARVLAEGLPGDTPVAQVMTRDPLFLTPDSLGSDILHTMLEARIGHLPVVQDGKIKGIITQTDLTRFQAVSSAQLVRDAASSETAEDMAKVTARIPRLLMQLVAANNAHEVVTRLITDVADTVTRRLLKLAEAELGPAPVPWLWLACGSQGRQEQTGISDQDNCLILDDSATEDDLAYFARFAKIVSDGLNTAGYYYCPGDMMATNPRWCQPVRVWRRYFRGWIDAPVPEAQMLASVMFDLRPIGGTPALFRDLQAETLAAAAKNSIFVAHMISNSLKHQPPLGLLRGFATIRSGEHKNHIDMKLNGVVPVADLARVYALQGNLTPVNTRARLEAAEHAGVISVSGGRDLSEAYDLIARLRLETQAALVRAGRRPDNFLAPSDLSDFERSHLRDAFVVVRTMQSALGHSRGALS